MYAKCKVGMEAWDLITMRKSKWIKVNRINEGLTEYAVCNKQIVFNWQQWWLHILYIYFDWPLLIPYRVPCTICCVDAYLWNGFHLAFHKRHLSVFHMHLRIDHRHFDLFVCLSNACCFVHWLLVNLNMTSALYTRCFFVFRIKFTAFE